MALITANAGTFAHTDTAAWVGGVLPVANLDDVFIPAGTTITVAASTTLALGDATLPAAFCLNVSGTLIINGTVSVNGAIRHQAAAVGLIIVNAGGVLQSTNATTAVVYEITRGTLRLRGTGIGAGRAIVRRGVGSAGFSLVRNATNESGAIDSEFGMFQNMTTVSVPNIFGSSSPTVIQWRMIDTVIDCHTRMTPAVS
jgi:hypothetical protein